MHIVHRKTEYKKAGQYPTDRSYTVGKDGALYFILGWEMVNGEDTEWSGCKEETGRLIVRMVGDAQLWSVDPEEIKEGEL